MVVAVNHIEHSIAFSKIFLAAKNVFEWHHRNDLAEAMIRRPSSRA